MARLEAKESIWLNSLCVALLAFRLGACFVAQGYEGLLTSTLHTFHQLSCGSDELSLSCPPRSRVLVLFADLVFPGGNSAEANKCFGAARAKTAGVECAFHVDINKLTDECKDKATCQLRTPSNFLLTDHGKQCALAARPGLNVGFQCLPVGFRRFSVCENESAVLKCRPGERLLIQHAFFGRAPDSEMPSQCPAEHPVAQACMNRSAEEVVHRMCAGKKKCSLLASRDLFGQPCAHGVRQNLVVVFQCVERFLVQPNSNRKKSALKHSSAVGMLAISGTTATLYEYALVDGVDSKLAPSPCANATTMAAAPHRLARTRAGVVVDWITTWKFLKEHREQLVLYVVLGLLAGLLLACSMMLATVCWRRRRQYGLERRESLQHVTGPGSDHSDVDFDFRQDIPVVRYNSKSLTLQHGEMAGNRSLNSYYS